MFIPPDIVPSTPVTYVKSTTGVFSLVGKQIQKKETKHNLIIKTQVVCSLYRDGQEGFRQRVMSEENQSSTRTPKKGNSRKTARERHTDTIKQGMS